MISLRFRLLLPVALIASGACSGPFIPQEPDIVDVTLYAPAHQVRTAVIQVLTDGGYEVQREDDHTVATSYREEIRGPWDGLLRWRFGTGRSRVDAMVTDVPRRSIANICGGSSRRKSES